MRAFWKKPFGTRAVCLALLVAVAVTLPIGATLGKYASTVSAAQFALTVVPTYVPPIIELNLSHASAQQADQFRSDNRNIDFVLFLTADVGCALDSILVNINGAMYSIGTDSTSAAGGITFTAADDTGAMGTLVVPNSLITGNPARIVVTVATKEVVDDTEDDVGEPPAQLPGEGDGTTQQDGAIETPVTPPATTQQDGATQTPVTPSATTQQDSVAQTPGMVPEVVQPGES